MSERNRDEKEEKAEEKAEEKHHEKEEEKHREKSWEEKWRRDPVSAIVWAFILIWAGLVLLAANQKWLTALVEVPEGLEMLGVWPLIMLGAGGIVLLGAVGKAGSAY